MYEATTQIRVRYAETDQMGVVYYGNYAQYFEVGRVEAIRQLGISYNELEKSGVLLPVVEMQMKFLRPAVYDDLITVRSVINEFPEDHKLTFIQEVYNEKGKLLTSGTVQLYFVDATTRKKTSMPNALKGRLAPYFEKE